jgi:hypothetical protein
MLASSPWVVLLVPDLLNMEWRLGAAAVGAPAVWWWEVECRWLVVVLAVVRPGEFERRREKRVRLREGGEVVVVVVAGGGVVVVVFEDPKRGMIAVDVTRDWE